MPTRIGIVNGIITTVTVKIETVYIFGIKICSIVGGNKSSPFGRVVSCIEVVEACFGVEIVASVTEGVSICYSGVSCTEDSAVTEGIVAILGHLVAISIINRNNVTLNISLEVICYLLFLLIIKYGPHPSRS